MEVDRRGGGIGAGVMGVGAFKFLRPKKNNFRNRIRGLHRVDSDTPPSKGPCRTRYGLLLAPVRCITISAPCARLLKSRRSLPCF